MATKKPAKKSPKKPLKKTPRRRKKDPAGRTFARAADEIREPRDSGPGIDSIMPERYRNALYHIVDGAMPMAWLGEFSDWLYTNKSRMVRGGDASGVERFNYELTEIDKFCPEVVAPLKRAIIDNVDDALGPCNVWDFNVQFVEMHATLYHMGAHFCWHDDAPGYDGTLVPSRRITFCYYMHAMPKQFTGGELEFLDGTAVEPKNNRLVFFHPLQQHRIRKVECYSAYAMHGRWAIMGWLHGDPPPGYEFPELRGTPRGG